MKKIISLSLIFVLAFALTACGGSDESEETSATTTVATTAAAATAAATTAAPSTSGVSADFKATMDSYEDFYDDYVAFMKKYQANPADPSLLTDYSSFLTQLNDINAKLAAIDSSSLTPGDLAYYTEVNTRITQKLASVAV